MEDFNKSITLDVKDDDGTASKTVPVNNTEETTSADIDDLWRENFIKHAADQFEKNFQNLMQNGNYIYIYFKRSTTFGFFK